jgi:CRISPR-associated helicase Cas3
MIYILPSQVLVTDIINRISRFLSRILRIIKQPLKIERDDGIEREVGLQDVYSGNIIVTTMDSYLARLLASPMVPKKYSHILVGKAVRAFSVLDEIHSYELYSLGFIKRILNFYNKINVNHIVMSATLNELQQNFLGLTDDKGYIRKVIYDPGRMCAKIRYRDELSCDGKPSSLSRRIIQILDELKPRMQETRILVVCNTVNKAQLVYKKIKKRYPNIEHLLIHSRFKDYHKESKLNLITKRILRRQDFNGEHANGVVVSTQVIESGVDVSADVLISEMAPPDALIQRIGRCARELRKPNGAEAKGALGEIHLIPIDPKMAKENMHEKPYPYPWILCSQAVIQKQAILENDIADNQLTTTLIQATPTPFLSSNRRRTFVLTTEDGIETLQDFIRGELDIQIDEAEFKELYRQVLEGENEANSWITERMEGYVMREMPRFRLEERINLIAERDAVEDLLKIKEEIDALLYLDYEAGEEEKERRERELWGMLKNIIQERAIRISRKFATSSLRRICGNTYFDPCYSYDYDEELGLIAKGKEYDI